MKSMTGYGRGECTLYNRKFIAEIKSVNHRYNDISIKMPRTLAPFEDTVKKIASKYIFRGKTDIYISFETYSDKDVKISLNETIADNYVEVLKNIKDRYNLKENISISLISRFPDVVNIENCINNDDEESKILECLINAVTSALNAFINMRQTEGEALNSNILSKLDIIYNYIIEIEKRAPLVSKEYRQKLLERISEFGDLNIDESRIVAEVTLFADKACIDEEITRMYSHIEQMKNILKESVPIGRKLDFLVQEMNREVNTIGSKSNDLEITNNIVELKSEIEKIREQVQNIE